MDVVLVCLATKRMVGSCTMSGVALQIGKRNHNFILLYFIDDSRLFMHIFPNSSTYSWSYFSISFEERLPLYITPAM